MTIYRSKMLRQDAFWYDGKQKTASRRSSTGGTVEGLRFGNTVDVLMAYGDGVDRSHTSLLNAVNAIGSAETTLEFAPGTWEIKEDVTVPGNFYCYIPAGAVFDVVSGKTLTFSGTVIRDSDTWTSGSGTVSASKTGRPILNIDDKLIDGQRTETNAVAFTQHDFHEHRYLYLKTDYGAKLDGSTLDDTPFANALADAATGAGNTIFIEDGQAVISQELAMSTALTRIMGLGARRSSIRSTAANKNMINITAARCAVSNLSLFNQVHSTTASAIITLGNGAVQCIVKDLDVVGGFYCIRALTGSTDNIVKDSVMRASFGGAIGYVQGGQTLFVQRVLFNHDWPVATPSSANFKGTWAATTPYNANDVISISQGFKLQCKTAGTSGSAEPTGSFLYETDITDGGVTWRLANKTGAASFKIDTASARITLEDCDMTGAFNRSLHVVDDQAGTDPFELRIIRCESSGVEDHGFDIRFGSRILIHGCEINQAVSNVAGKNAVALFSDVNGDVIITNNRLYASGYDRGVYLAHNTAANKGNIQVKNNQIFGFDKGVFVEAGRKLFSIVGNDCGVAAHDGQGNTTAIEVNTGASDDYLIAYNNATGATTGIVDNGTGTNKRIEHNLTDDSTSVASAATVTLPANGDVFTITGTTNITSITASWNQRTVKLIFADVLTLTDGSNLQLAGNFVTTANDSIVLTCDGTNWNESSRSVN